MKTNYNKMTMGGVWACFCITNAVAAEPELKNLSLTIASPFLVDKGYKLYIPTSPLPENASEYEGEWQQVLLNSHRTQGRFEVSAGKQITFFAEPRVDSKALAKMKVGEKEDYFVILLPDSKNAGYKCVSIEDGTPAWGSYYIFNLTSSKIKYAFDGQGEGFIEPRQFEVVKGDTEKSQRVKISILDFDNNYRTLRETAWKIRPNMREFVFYYRNPESKRVHWKHVTERKKD